MLQQQDQVDAQVRVQALWGIVRFHRSLRQLNTVPTREGLAVESVTGRDPTRATDRASSVHAFTAQELWHIVRHFGAYRALARRCWRPLRATLARVRVPTLEVRVELGTGDAVSTGCLVGAAWGVLGIVLGGLEALVRLQTPPRLMVHPEFRAPTLRLEGRCIGRLRLGYAILGAMQLFVTWHRSRRDLGIETRQGEEDEAWSTPSKG